MLNKKFTCQFCGKQHFIPTREVVTRKGAILSLPGFLSKLVKRGKILILSDNITYEIAGKRCAEVLRGEYEVSSLILCPRASKRVQAEEKYLPEILKHSHGKSAILTVGTGSITDMGKYVANRLNIPVVTIPTAPSMNAYSSGVAALLMGGIKVTSPVKPAIGVLTDLDVISQAPLDLIKAGLADSLAKSFANADWRISSLLTGEDFCPLPLKITTKTESKYIHRGEELIQRKEEVISHLMDGLNAGGFSMVIAGKTSPASGGEHLISHYLDMVAHQQGREPFCWHGLQVGVGIMVSAHIYERLKDLSPEEIESRLSHHWLDYESFTKDRFFNKTEFGQKLPILRDLSQNLPPLWEQIKEEVFPLVYPLKQIKEYLGKAECPLCFEEIGIGKGLARRTVMNSRYIRKRLTILDIASELGILEEVVQNL